MPQLMDIHYGKTSFKIPLFGLGELMMQDVEKQFVHFAQYDFI
jgi:hypothetical protein